MSRVRVRIALGGTHLEYSGSRAFFERAIAPLVEALRGEGRSGTAEPTVRGPQWTPAQPQQFAQFAAQVGPRAEGVDQRIMAFAFYLWNFEKRESCDAGSIRAFFRTLQLDPPEDLDARIEGLVTTKRFLEPAGEEAWRLSTKGVNYVKNRLLGPGSGPAPSAGWDEPLSPS